MKVLVTGATGYIAGFCIEDLLRQGHSVRGTMRNPDATDRVAHLWAVADELGAELEFVRGELSEAECWPAAVVGCDWVMHTASPLPVADPKHEMELIGPAVDGTRHVLAAAADAGVKRVVLTSSSAAIINVDRPEGHVYTGDDFSDPEQCSAYPKSKTLAERAAWELHKALPDDKRFELVVVNPVLVIGPVQHARANTSLEPVLRLMRRQLPAVPHLGFTLVDVRDVAVAHRLALEVPEAAGKRYLLCSQFMWMRDLSVELAADGHSVPTGHLPYAALWLASWFDSAIAYILPQVGQRLSLSSAKAQRELGWTVTDVKQTVRDCGRSIAKFGLAG